MNFFYIRLLRLMGGIFLFSLGIVITINANIGYSPWDVFHVGLSKTLGMSIGTASMIAGLFFAIVVILMGEKLGLGTVVNIIFIGIFIDLLANFHLIPLANNFTVGIIMMIIGLFVISLGSYFYIGSAFGAGPRDSLMVVVARKTGVPVGVCRGTIELMALLVGWKLGGMVGLGTVLSALLIGFCIQITFKLLNFDATKVKHENFQETYKIIFRK